MPRKRTTRVYDRGRRGTSRYWGDFRDYGDVGGGREPLIPDGEGAATSDPDVAAALAAARLGQLEKRRRTKNLLGVEKETTFAAYASYHLEQMADGDDITDEWLAQAQRHLEAAVEHFGEARSPDTIAAADVQQYATWLARRGNGRGATLASGTRRQYLNSLSKLYRRLASEGYVLPGYNPVAALMDKPKPAREEARWLEVHDAALLLEAARLYEPRRSDSIGGALGHAIVAGYLLSGCREDELLGLEMDDIDMDRKVITVRENTWRRLKSRNALRPIPIWPQLEEIWRAYLNGEDGPDGRLLFPSARSRKEKMITDLRKTLDSVAAMVGRKPGEIRTKMFRHTYCAARLQTTDGGAPVAKYTVARELGHGGTQLVDRVYGHLGQIRHRSEVVEYRVDQHAAVLGTRLTELRSSV